MIWFEWEKLRFGGFDLKPLFFAQKTLARRLPHDGAHEPNPTRIT